MQLILAWVAFPAVLTALGAGWGVLVEKAVGREVQGALVVALGLMAALGAAAILTASRSTAPAAVAIVAAVGVAGLALGWPQRRRISRWPLLAAIGALAAYGAPTLLSGQATFAGYNTLDDTAVWLGITDQLFSHGRPVDLSQASTYSAIIDQYLHLSGYPVGGFMLLGVGRGIVGIDLAWAFQPYLALCGALVGLAAYALFERVVASRPLRAGLAFVAAQPALLFGYGLFGAIKELTAAWVLLAGIALLAPYLGRPAPRPREAIVLALPATALITILGAGAVVWLALPLAVLAASWGWSAWGTSDARTVLASAATLVGATALLALPALLVMSTFVASDGALYVKPTGTASDVDALGGLLAPLSPFQLAGIWPVGDFRLVAATVPTAILVAVVAACAIGAVVVSVRRRDATLALYVAVAVLGVVVVELAGSSPWVVGKALAIGAPAVLAAALLGGALLLERSRSVGVIACALLAGGVLWSNVLAYHDVRLAPRPRLAELQKIGAMISGRGPTLVNEEEVYAAYHFLRAAAPTGPSQFRRVALALRGGQRLGSGGFADLDSFPLATVLTYRTIVTSRSPTQSRPPAAYRRVWRGRWYEVWQRPPSPASLRELPLEHLPGGDSNVLPYCGRADKGSRDACSIAPASIPPCSAVRLLRSAAVRAGGGLRLVAYERASPIVVRAADIARRPPGWADENAKIVAARSGTMVVRLRAAAAGRYTVWLGGSFGRGFSVSVDGRPAGAVRELRGSPWTYERAGTLRLAVGMHTLSLRYSRASLGPGGGRDRDTTLVAIALEQLDAPARMIDVPAADAASLCGRWLDWIEVVRPRPAATP
jgi:hypothetical protein